MSAFRMGALGIAVAVASTPVVGQDDFRHVDQDRPLRVEDAYPIKFQEWEWEIGARGSAADGGEFETSGLVELKTGFARNWEFGVEIHSEWARTGGASATGVEEAGAHLLFNINQEGRNVPAFGIRADLASPGAGDLGRGDFGGRLRGMASRSFGRWRVHANGAHTWSSSADGGDFWSGGLAVDRPLGLSSRAVLGGMYAEFPDGQDARVWAELGARLQISKSMVLDFGLASRVDEWSNGTPNVGLTVGLSRAFGFGGLVRVPAYPNPRIN